jgi:hypothetical protein
MNQDLVIVKSKTINNESVPIVIKVAEVRHGEIMDEREISRSYVFEDFEAMIPLKYAKILVKQSPKEFHIDRAVGEEPSNKVKRAVKSSKETAKGFKCDICGKDDIKSKAGLTAHIRYNHPEEFAKLYPTKVKPKKKPEEAK